MAQDPTRAPGAGTEAQRIARAWQARKIREAGEAAVWLPACYYCGDVAPAVDHVLPRPIADRADVVERLIAPRLVPCCHECNSLLGPYLADSLAERRRIARARLRHRYRTVLTVPEWAEADLARLGPGLRAEVLAALAVKRRTRERLAWSWPRPRAVEPSPAPDRPPPYPAALRKLRAFRYGRLSLADLQRTP